MPNRPLLYAGIVVLGLGWSVQLTGCRLIGLGIGTAIDSRQSEFKGLPRHRPATRRGGSRLHALGWSEAGADRGQTLTPSLRRLRAITRRWISEAPS
jgi:hypothetical protein